MMLGEALTLRARQAQAMNDLSGRIRSSAVAQEGDNPPEDVRKLIDEYLALSSEHAVLVRRIVQTNLHTMTDDGTTRLIELLQDREILIRSRNLYGQVARAAAPAVRYGRLEVKFVPQISVEEVRGKERELSRLVNERDMQIQKLNWSTTLED